MMSVAWCWRCAIAAVAAADADPLLPVLAPLLLWCRRRRRSSSSSSCRCFALQGGPASHTQPPFVLPAADPGHLAPALAVFPKPRPQNMLPWPPQVRAGTGGDEACLFALELFRMYERFAAAQGWRFEVRPRACLRAWGRAAGVAAVQVAAARTGLLSASKASHPPDGAFPPQVVERAESDLLTQRSTCQPVPSCSPFLPTCSRPPLR